VLIFLTKAGHPPYLPKGPTTAAGGAIVLELKQFRVQTMRLGGSKLPAERTSYPCVSRHFEVDSFISSSLILDHECAAVDLPDGSTGDRPRLYIPSGLKTNLQLAEFLRKRED